LASGRTLGFEALARWQHPDYGLILPEKFIPLAEEMGLIVPISGQILRLACRQMRAWSEQLPLETSLVVSVNVSGKQLAHGDFPERIAEVLHETGLPPHRLKLEITESAIIENSDSVAGLLHQLKDMGIGIWLDDFGTGYSSFSHLHRFPFDTLKIDSSFVQKLDQRGAKPEITRTIVLLAHSLGMEAIAEGVESPSQRDRLCELECDSVQGYLFSAPLTAEEAGELITTGEAFSIHRPPTAAPSPAG
jgi:EAL domain-containing protein (putative c-di-GMP-specific phosphodiesterase class I)